MFENEVIDALPTGGLADAPLLRNFLIKRMVFNILSTEDPQDFEALDGDTGAIPEVIGWDGTFFWLDPADTTSAHDGVSVLVTSDGYRYKSNPALFNPESAISDSTTAPPGSPSIGDVYLVPAGATGAWSSHQDDIAIFTRNGWQFETPRIGRWLLIEDTDGYQRYTSLGWVYGPGARSFSDSSIPFSAAIAWGTRFVVENQTTNTPPTATLGLCYIVGASPTGVWSGKALKIAICEIGGTWTFYTPTNGYAAYDKALNASYTFNGAAWVSSSGAWRSFADSGVTTTGSTSAGGSGSNTYSATTAPTTTKLYVEDTGAVLSVTADYVGQKIRVRYNADQSASSNSIIALYRDAETTAIFWNYAYPGSFRHNCEWVVTAGDTNAHTYKVRWQKVDASADAAPTRRNMTIEKAA